MILIPVPEDLEGQWQDLFEQAGRKMNDPRVIAEGGEGTIDGAIRVLEQARADVDAVLQALRDADANQE